MRDSLNILFLNVIRDAVVAVSHDKTIESRLLFKLLFSFRLRLLRSCQIVMLYICQYSEYMNIWPLLFWFSGIRQL